VSVQVRGSVNLPVVVRGKHWDQQSGFDVGEAEGEALDFEIGK
jgi:hypothetical protein